MLTAVLAWLGGLFKRIIESMVSTVAPAEREFKSQIVVESYEAIKVWRGAEAECQRARRAAEEETRRVRRDADDAIRQRDRRISQLEWALERAGVSVPKPDHLSDWDAPPPPDPEPPPDQKQLGNKP